MSERVGNTFFTQANADSERFQNFQREKPRIDCRPVKMAGEKNRSLSSQTAAVCKLPRTCNRFRRRYRFSPSTQLWHSLTHTPSHPVESPISLRRFGTDRPLTNSLNNC